MKKYALRWDLEKIFKGGSLSKPFKQFLKEIKNLIATFEASEDIKKGIQLWQTISEQLGEASSFVGCLLAQNVHDKEADVLETVVRELFARFEIASNLMDEKLKKLPERVFEKLCKELSLLAYPLQERRRRALDKLDPSKETLITGLSVDGYHGWSQLYGTLIGQVQIPIQIKNKEEKLSWGQAYNRMSSLDRNLRKQVFDRSNEVWKRDEALYSQLLNRISGYRLKVYEYRKWDFLKEPLDVNHMEKETLDTMWRVISKNKKHFLKYFKIKAKLLGLKKLSWYDLEAPLSLKIKEKLITYQEAADYIVQHFSSFSPKMGAFAKRAFEEKWIEAEDRPGKRPGGFCTGIPLKKESRIFMTFSGNKESLFTLAHELGHAYHNHVIFDKPEMARHFPMNLAETASTFAEMVISEASFRQEKDPFKVKWLLDAKLQRTVVFLFNIHARYLFETRLYEQRKKGALSPDELCKLMETAQKEAYCNSLETYHPYFWISKIHFNITDVPFYNFPYTFGYLFSLGVYLKGMESKGFEDSYISLLGDTGSMSAENLAHKHLGVNLRHEDFWQKGIDFLKRDIELFEQLV